ncbi:MAG TPA: hypothetical protein DEF82_08715 [Crocinitomicaceae bacterium]|nr:hypothetical protein [Flavobacteriales bacterium]HBW86799.1 hypothetical protein [Crocinitomicaceae bacterium]
MLSLHFNAVLIVSEDNWFVTKVLSKLREEQLNALVERCHTISDFKVMMEELIIDQFNAVLIITDYNENTETFRAIEKFIENNEELINVTIQLGSELIGDFQEC